jgi:cytochrome P450
VVGALFSTELFSTDLFSTDLGQAAAAEIQRLMPVVMTGIAVRMITPRQLDGWPIPPNRRFDRAASRLRQVIEQVIEAYRTQPPGDDLLSMLLAMTDQQACDEVISLLMAGTETPGNTLAWLLHEIGRHPEVERRLHAEIDAAGPRPDLSKLTYTSQVINEVLRLHPVLLFTRRVTAPTVVADTELPVGTELAFSPYALHRDPGLYPDPARFDPDRWQSAGRLFQPFGAGRHKCVGEAFAWTELHIVVATLVRRWRLVPAAGHVVREVVAEVPRPNALPMVVQPR